MTASSSPPSGASGCGRLGRVAASSSRSPSTAASSACIDLTSAERSLIRAITSRGVAARALCGGDLVGGAVLLGAAALHLGQQLAAAGVELEQPIEVSGGTAARQRLAGRARVRSDRAQVEHRAGARGYWPSAAACCSSDWISLAFPGCGGRSTSEPEYSATNSATASASSPTRMFCGMIAPEKPPLRIA